MMVVCEFCNKENDARNRRCVSCGGLIKDRKYELTTNDINLLKKFADITEKMLQASSVDVDFEFTAGVFVAAFIQSAVIYLTFTGWDSIFWAIVVSVFVAVIIVFAGSLLMRELFRNAARSKFDKRVRYIIHQYLEKMDFTQDDFKNIVRKKMKEDSYIYKYVDEI